MSTCKDESCDIFPIFGYSDNVNIACQTHKKEDMIMTFKQEDYEKYDIFNMKKLNRICIFKDCKTNATFNFLGLKQRLFCSKHKLETMVTTKTNQCDENTLIQCNICKIEKNYIEFEHGRYQCRKCRNKIYKERINSDKIVYLGKLINYSVGTAKRRLSKGRKAAGTHELNIEDISRIYENQNGKCYYSGLPLVLKQLSDWQCSIERKDQNEGYVMNNVVLICQEFQCSSQWTCDKYKEFTKLIFMQNDTNTIEKVARKKSIRQKLKNVLIDNVVHYECKYCNTFKCLNDFNACIVNGCKDCVAIYNKKYRETPIGHLKNRLCDMKSHSKTRKHPAPQYDIDDLIEMYNSQNGLCYYSKIGMTFGSYKDKWWTASIERKNISKGYVRGNVILVCFEFNVTNRYSLNTDNTTHQIGGWSIHKINILKDHIIGSQISAN